MEKIFRSEAQVAQIIQEFEARHRLFDLKVRGISLWRILRFSVAISLQNLSISSVKTEKRDRLWAAIRSVPGLLKLNKRFAYGVKSYSMALRVRTPVGEYEDVYYQEVLNNMPGGVRLYSSSSCEYDKRKPSAKPPSINFTALELLGAVLARILPVRSDQEKFSVLASLLKSNFKFDSYDADFLIRCFSTFWWQSQIYRLVLRLTGLRTMFIVDAGEHALIRACRVEGVYVVELQHGIYTENHPNLLPGKVLSENTATEILLPNIIGTYGDYWTSKLPVPPAPIDFHVLSIGNSMCDKYRKFRRRIFAPSIECPILVFTTQGLAKAEVILFLQAFLKEISKPCKLIIKLHPTYDSDKSMYVLAFKSDSRVLVHGANDEPNTFELISSADMHVSIASACHYDALSIGTPTLVVGLPGYELVRPMIDAGEALFAQNPTEMASIVDARIWHLPTLETQERYCKSGFLEKISDVMASRPGL